MIDDIIDDEIELMHGKKEPENYISSKVFERPLSDLKLSKLISVDIDTNIQDTVKLMQENHNGCVVITENGKLAGIFTERDLMIRVVNIIEDIKTTKISEVMTTEPLWLMETDMIAYAINNMHVGGYRHIPIVNENREPVRAVSVRNINTYVFNHFPKTINNILSHPYRGKSKREDA